MAEDAADSVRKTFAPTSGDKVMNGLEEMADGVK